MKKTIIKFDVKTRHAGMSTLITIVVLAAVIIVNLLVGETSIQVDLTPKKLFTLTGETRDLLNKLDRDVTILGLYGPGEEPLSIMETVLEYERHSNFVSVRLVDPDRDPALLARFSQDNQTVPNGSFIVSSSDNFRIIPARDFYDVSFNAQGQPQVLGQTVEQQITAALAYVTSGRIPKIYEVVGHNEAPLTSLGFAPRLKQANYETAEISLLRDGIPEDAALVTVIGPRTDLTEGEAAVLGTWLEERGGSLLAALDITEQPLENLNNLLSKWDIDVRHGLVLETRKNRLIAEFGDNPFVFAPFISDHEALKPLREAKLDPVFQVASGFQRTSAEQRRLEYFSLLTSSKDSWLRTDLNSENSGSPNPISRDQPGPIDVAVAVRQRNPDTYEPEGAVVVALGSATTFRGPGPLGQIKANVDLVLNLINWAVDDASVVNIQSKSLFRLPLQINTKSAIFYFILVVIVIPAFGFSTGVVIYLRRRNK